MRVTGACNEELKMKDGTIEIKQSKHKLHCKFENNKPILENITIEYFIGEGKYLPIYNCECNADLNPIKGSIKGKMFELTLEFNNGVPDFSKKVTYIKYTDDNSQVSEKFFGTINDIEVVSLLGNPNYQNIIIPLNGALLNSQNILIANYSNGTLEYIPRNNQLSKALKYVKNNLNDILSTNKEKHRQADDEEQKELKPQSEPKSQNKYNITKTLNDFFKKAIDKID